MAGDPVALRYVVTNRGTRNASGLVAHLILPIGFMAAEAATSSSAARDVYLPLRELPPGGFDTAVVSGSFVSGVNGDVLFRAEAGRRSVDGKFLPSQRTEARVPLVGGDLVLRLVANGSDADQAIDPGASLRVACAYENSSPEPIKNVSLRLGFETIIDGRSTTGVSMLDWSLLDDAAHGVSTTKSSVQTIRYGQDAISALGTLMPQAQGTIEVGLPTLPVASGTRDALIRITLDGLVTSVGESVVHRVVAAKPIMLRYRSGADVDVEARYFTEEGAPIGSGPLPPAVGKTTAYRVIWHLRKDLHTLAPLAVSATLPKIAAWGNKTIADAGDIAYDEASRTVRWTLAAMPEDTRELDGAFEVQITPSAFDVDRFASVLGETRFEAEDTTLNETVTRSKPPLSSDLQNDEAARGKGVVKTP